MNAPASTAPRLHPLLALAAGSVILASAVAIGALTGLIPHGTADTPALSALSSLPALPPQSTAPSLASAPAPGPAAQPVAVAAPAAAQSAPKAEAKARSATARRSVPAQEATGAAPARLGMSHAEAVTAHERLESTRVPAPVQIAQGAGATMTDAPPVTSGSTPVAAPKAACATCGVVVSVRSVEQKGEGSGLGAVAGGVTGAVVGKQMGKGTGNTIMTLLGAAGGAYAGHQIEKNVKTSKRFDVEVRMEDGSLRTLSQDTEPAFRTGDKVRVENGALRADL